MPATARREAPESEPEFTPAGPLADPTSILGTPASWEGDTDEATSTTSTASPRDLSGSAPPTTDSTPATGLSNEETSGPRRVHWPPDDELYDIRVLSERSKSKSES